MSLMDEVLSKENLNLAYKKVISNKGASGIDKMTCDEVLDYLKTHGNDLVCQIKSRQYQPQPVKRVEIPKPNGGIRKLGIPTVVDRIVQQAMVQVLSPMFEPTFSDYSYGFRPNRSCLDAINQALVYLNEGYEWVVDLDLEKFFDNVNHDKLIRIVDNTCHDSDITSLIMKYLKAGVMIDGQIEETNVGTPQGGNLSPLLSNIMLNVLDKELEHRTLRFVRYADDCVIFVKTKFSAERVMRNIVSFIENKLKLKVNATKTHVDRADRIKYLGYGFDKHETWFAKPHEESIVKFRNKLKRLTKRSWSVDLDYRLIKIKQSVIGWVNYFKLGKMKRQLKMISGWLRTRIRMIIWKQWKTTKKREESLIKLGKTKCIAHEHANTRKGYMSVACGWILCTTITNERLKKRGLVSPLDYYLEKIVA